jgi:chromosome segregation ATPase
MIKTKVEIALKQLKEKNEQQQKQVKELEEMKQKQAKEIQILNKALEERFNGNEDYQNLVYEISTLRIENEELEIKLQEKEELEQVLQELKQQKNSLELQINESKTDLQLKDKKILDLEEMYKSVQLDAKQEKEALLRTIEDKSQQSRKFVQQLEQALQEATQQRTNLESQLKQLQVELQVFQEVVQQKANLELQVTQLKSELQELSNQLDVFNVLNLNLQEKIAEEQREKDRLKCEVKELNLKIKELESELDYVAKYKDKVNELKQSQYSLKVKLAMFSKDAETTNLNLQHLKEDYRKLVEKHAKLEDSKKLMQQALIDQLNNERQNLKEKQQNIERLNHQVELIQKENDSLKKCLQQYEKAKEIDKSKRKILRDITNKTRNNNNIL